MFNTHLKAWLRSEPEAKTPTGVVVDVPEIRYDDARNARLADVTRTLRDQRSQLVLLERKWEAVTGRSDPDVYAWRSTVGPKLLALRAEIQRLDAEATALTQAITDTKAQVAAYAALVAETTGWSVPLVARCSLSDAELHRAYTASRVIESTAADLLAKTGDRSFRRPRVDPYRQMKEALEDTVRRLTGLHLRRRSLLHDTPSQPEGVV